MEFKFKMYDTINSRWIDGFDTIEYDGEKECILDFLTGTSGKAFCVLNDILPHIKIVQYAGLKDKNNVDFYEGAIDKYREVLRFGTFRSEDVHASSGSYGRVYNYFYGWYWEDAQGEQAPFDGTETIIGHVFDNPELVSKEQLKWI